MIRNVQNPQEASKLLVDHALAKFSTDNLSVMVVRFDSKKVRENTTIDIGVEHDPAQKKGEISEVEMIVEQARRNSGIPPEGSQLSETEKEDLTNTVIQEQTEEQEAGPELTPGGQLQAEKVMQDKKASGSGGAGPGSAGGKTLT